ncbi:MAG: shikimate dehydrogenase [Bacillaceae bacterium]
MGEIYGVIGNPIGHSMSPAMHNSAFQALKMDGYYQAFHVKEENLGATMEAMKLLQIKGFNVTTPHKVAVMAYLDTIDEVAEKIGAVNTVVHENGKLIGYNTDGYGYIRSLEEEMGITVKGKNVLLIGAGGACRALYYSFLEKGVCQIDIANRTLSKAREIVGKESRSSVYQIDAISDFCMYDIIINTTIVGMYPHIDNTPISISRVKEGAIVSDIIYNPLKTRFLKEAETVGARIHNGLGMFVYQGALAFEKWTGIFPPVEVMKKIVTDKLGE